MGTWWARPVGLSQPYRLLSKPLLGRLALNEVKPNADHVIYIYAGEQ